MRYRGGQNIPYAAAGEVLLPAFFLYGTAGQDCHRSTGFVLTDAEDPETNGLSGTGNQSDVLGGAVCDAHSSFFSGDPAPHTGQLYGEIVPAVAEDGTGF